MAIHSVQRGQISRPQRNAAQSTVIPAPTGGVDARAPTGNMPLDVCIYAYNLVAQEYGMLLRPGYREWCIDLENVSSDGVFTVMAFSGQDPGAADDRLFAVTNEGIWDVTTYNSPTSVLTFGNNALGAGHGPYCHYTDQAGDDYLYYADGLNGLFIYTNATKTWAQETGINGVTLTNVAFITPHKRRLWLVEAGSTTAYYLSTADSRQGDTTPFYFGTKFPHGGQLAGLYSWSVDVGSGVDEFLVAISTAGDVVVYQGEDPSDATTWDTRGTYFIGDIPRGRRFAAEYSGDLYILSSFGLIAMSDLLKGVTVFAASEKSLAFKVARPLREAIRNKITLYGWEPSFLPSLGSLVITTPKQTTERWIQYSMNLATAAWGFWRDVPMNCAEDYNGKIFFGTTDGRVCVMDVSLDNVRITPPEEGTNGSPIEFSLLSTYTDLGQPGLYKRVSHIRPNFYVFELPTYNIKALYDYQFDEPLLPTTAAPAPDNAWDISLWDQAVWTTSTGAGRSALFGGSGVGRTVCLALRGTSTAETRLISYDLTWDTGWAV